VGMCRKGSSAQEGKIVRKSGERGDLNRSRASFIEGERLPSVGRTFALVTVCVCGRGTNICPRLHGEGAIDHSVLGERSLPQCVQHN
jgi:hypothetical protein